MGVVLFVSAVALRFSWFYLVPCSKGRGFLWLTVLFVSSMVAVIVTPNLVFLILGWDGLGLISFFLITFYSNPSSTMSGVFTLIMNRLGDGLFVVTIVFRAWEYSISPFVREMPGSYVVVVLLVVTCMTKRAIFPFSPWLPLAMAAPTPISSLVHSSTLVTAGLFIMMRFRYLLYTSMEVVVGLLAACLFTSLYAGLGALVETDLKKLVALSTLRHLGFIGGALARGLLQIAFFHLLAHALFKSLLFMSLGDIIVALRHRQDMRHLLGGGLMTRGSTLLIQTSLGSLGGIPMMRGFFTKDLILEIRVRAGVSGGRILVLYVNVGLTLAYTLKILSYRTGRFKGRALRVSSKPPLRHTSLLGGLSVIGPCFAFLFWGLSDLEVTVVRAPAGVKGLPRAFLVAGLCALWGNPKAFRGGKELTEYLTRILNLTPLLLLAGRKSIFPMAGGAVKTTELGGYGHIRRFHVPALSFNMGRKALGRIVSNPLSTRVLVFLFLGALRGPLA